MKFSCLFLAFAVLFVSESRAQTLLKTIPIASANLMTTDELGNVYVLSEGRNITKWNRDGDSLCNYRTASNHQILALDASNPLELFVVQARTNKLFILDRLLTPKMELDLGKIGVMNFDALAQSRDGNFWVYDNLQQKLKKFDRQLRLVAESNDLRTEHRLFLTPKQIEERSERVLVADVSGNYIFDRYGTLVQALHFSEYKNFQLVADMLIGFDGKKLQVFNFNELTQATIDVPEILCDIMDARIENGRMYVLCSEYLYLYEWKF